MSFNRKKVISLGTILTLALSVSAVLSGRPCAAAQKTEAAAKPAAPVEPPLAEKDLIKLIKHNRHHLEKVAEEVKARGLDFEFTPDIEKKVKKVGADPNLITYMKQYTPSAIAARKSGVQGPVVSTAEATAYNKLKGERDPDTMIKDAESYVQQFPKSPLLAYIYAIEATAYQQKNDAANVLKFGEKSLNIDPKNLMSLLLVSEVLPQPQMLRGITEAQKVDRLTRAAQYAQQALQEINKLPKQAKETDAAYEKRKSQISSDVYSALGMVHLERATMGLVGMDQGELAKAAENYKMAIAKSSPPNPADYYRLGEAYVGEKKIDDAIDAFTKAGQLGEGTIIQQLAEERVQKLKASEATSQPKNGTKP